MTRPTRRERAIMEIIGALIADSRSVYPNPKAQSLLQVARRIIKEARR